MPDSWDQEFDVVVLGSGGAGLSAALTAAVNGARVAVYEKASTVGGTTAVSGGIVWIPAHDRLDGTELKKVPFSGSQFNPTFDIENASTLDLDNGQEVFFFDHISGTSIVYRKDMNGDESILMENYTTVNRFNADEIVANGAVFESLWDNNASTYTLNKTTMQLEYYTVNQEDENNGKSAGDPLMDCAWGLTIQGSAST